MKCAFGNHGTKCRLADNLAVWPRTGSRTCLWNLKVVLWADKSWWLNIFQKRWVIVIWEIIVFLNTFFFLYVYPTLPLPSFHAFFHNLYMCTPLSPFPHDEQMTKNFNRNDVRNLVRICWIVHSMFVWAFEMIINISTQHVCVWASEMTVIINLTDPRLLWLTFSNGGNNRPIHSKQLYSLETIHFHQNDIQHYV